MRCGNCNECLADPRLRPAPVERATLPGAPAVTSGGLEKHGKRFGWHFVAKTAAELGLKVEVPKDAITENTKNKSSSSGPTLRERIQEMLNDGRSVEVIAEVENLSASRARRLVAELGGDA